MATISLPSFSLSAQITGLITNTLKSGAVVSLDIGTGGQLSFTSGTGDGQANRIWHSPNRYLLSSATESISMYNFSGIDLGAGAGCDVFGQSLTLASVALLIVACKPTSLGPVRVGGEGSGAAWNSLFGDDTSYHDVYPGGPLVLMNWPAAGYPVANTTNHLLKFAAPSGNALFDVLVLGRQ